MSSSYQTLQLTVGDDGVCEIVLSRPELMNRFDPELHHELTRALRDIAVDTSVRAVVLASTGSAFSAGGDFELMESAHKDADVRREIIGDARRLLDAFLGLPQPIVVAVQGPAIGLGATVAMLCDAVVAARAAVLADTHVAVGLVAGDGGCLVWPQAVGMTLARRHLLTGDPLDAETALRLGVVTDLVDTPAEAHPAALAIARKMARLAPLAVQGTKRALNQVSRQRADEVVDLALAFEEQTLASEDLLEGVAAFRERRRPTFSGR
ncbi:enoyl-CoA hydratase/isomerase family protein [Nocardioides immobilis]|uniref:Enoyl-CoA hydratase/isomerase family protein n=1 Tax=Nocardioides immobilis TaxID=2049295 RepID=A0A417Y6B2_9ACTN|nr:enoyl-CoA hydratase-related protein [Nocardioides immobilis]RHW28135.1 enoyl-CoA hydratase/isomerase family protein [Nocardioides immobilis]